MINSVTSNLYNIIHPMHKKKKHLIFIFTLTPYMDNRCLYSKCYLCKHFILVLIFLFYFFLFKLLSCFRFKLSLDDFALIILNTQVKLFMYYYIMYVTSELQCFKAFFVDIFPFKSCLLYTVHSAHIHT